MGFLRWHKEEETLNERMLREAGYASDSTPLGPESEEEPSDEITFFVELPDLTGDGYEFVVLEDRSLIVDESAPDLSDLAEAIEQDLEPPYRASAGRQDDKYWLVTAKPIDIDVMAVEGGEELELSSVDGVRTFKLDGEPADAARIPSSLLRRGEERGDDFVVRARRIDGDMWEVTADPL
jgi:hypothetical protein